MKIAIVGSRTFKDFNLMKEFIGSLPMDTIIVSGGAPGADSIAAWCAKERGMPKPHVYRPDYDKYPSWKAPLMRNTTIVEKCDKLVAFWNGISAGTMDAVTKARKRGIPVEIKRF